MGPTLARHPPTVLVTWSVARILACGIWPFTRWVSPVTSVSLALRRLLCLSGVRKIVPFLDCEVWKIKVGAHFLGSGRGAGGIRDLSISWAIWCAAEKRADAVK